MKPEVLVLGEGGRVLHVAGFGETIEAARENAYAAIGKHAIHFAHFQYRQRIALEA